MAKEFSIGEHILVGATEDTGIIKFIGTTQFSAGEWVGVELDHPNGKNDGMVKDIRYFECKPKHGIFVRKTGIRRPEDVIKESKEEPKTTAEPRRSKVRHSTSKEQRHPTRSSQLQSPQVISPQTEQTQKQLAEAVEERDIGRIRASLLKATNDGGVSAMEIQMAQHVLNFEDKKNMCNEIDKVRCAIDKLAQAVSRAEQRSLQVEQSAKANQEAIASNSAQVAIKAWMAQCVETIERSVWLSLETKVEAKVRSAIEKALGGKVDLIRPKSTLPATSTQSSERPREPSAEVSAVTKIQRIFRTMNARQHVKDKQFSTAVFAARRRHVAWSSIFDEHAARGSGLLEGSLTKALRRIYPRLSTAQCKAIFDGYTTGTGSIDVDLAGYCSICEAAATGDREVAEFADLCVEDFVALEDAKTIPNLIRNDPESSATKARRAEDTKKIQNLMRNDPESFAATKIQARYRGSVVRQSGKDREAACRKIQRAVRNANARLKATGRSFCNAAYAVRKRHAAWSNIFDEALRASGGNGNASLMKDPFRKALRLIHPRLAEEQCDALHDGYVNGTDQLAVSLAGFCAIAEAVAVSDSYAAEFADISVEKFRSLGEVKAVLPDLALENAAKKIQRLVRRNQARSKVEDLSIAKAAVLARRRHQAWASIFDDVVTKLKSNGSLNQEGFSAALREIHPSITLAQVRALWKGFCEGTEQCAVDIGSFCAIAEAIAMGPKVAAEYADISVEAYEAFGLAGAEAAATKVQAARRGHAVRQSMQATRNGTQDNVPAA